MNLLVKTNRTRLDNLRENVLSILFFPFFITIVILLNNDSLLVITLFSFFTCLFFLIAFLVEFNTEITSISHNGIEFKISFFYFFAERTIDTKKLKIQKRSSKSSNFRIDFEIDGGYSLIQQSNQFWTEQQFQRLLREIEVIENNSTKTP